MRPVYSIPLAAEEHLFEPLALGGALKASLPLGGLDWLRPELGMDYDYASLRDGYALSTVGIQAGLGASFVPVPWLELGASLDFRYAYLSLEGESETTRGWTPGALASLGAELLLDGPVSFGLGLSGRYDFGMYAFLEPYASITYRVGRKAAPSRQDRLAPLVAEASAATKAAMEPSVEGVFPVFYKYYDDHPLGSITVANLEKAEWKDVAVTFFVKQYMDAPKECGRVASVAPGAQAKVDLVALFNDQILAVTEATKLNAEVVVSYVEDGLPGTVSRNASLRVYDRNAMTWDDDRHAAAFVSAKDPAVLAFAKGLAGDMKARRNKAINEKLQVAAAIHEATIAQGLNYVPDPSGLFAGSKQRTEIDFLQFPRQTLEYRAGDCDDLSILYAALLESVGVEAAFVTVPGHIFVAASLDLTPAEAKAKFARYDELVLSGDRAWLPIEVTVRDGGFLAAWETGAREWRDAASKGLAKLLPLRAAWEAFEPVALPGSASIAPPDSGPVVAKVLAATDAIVEREIAQRAVKLRAEVERSQGASAAVNALGVLYAQYGLTAKAREQFEAILAREEYPAALVNMGGLLRAEGRLEEAKEYLERAFRKAPQNALVLVSAARINHELENYGAVRKYYQELKRIDPALAERYAYLDIKGEEGTKAAEASGLKSEAIWME